jgi:hypothetical protein
MRVEDLERGQSAISSIGHHYPFILTYIYYILLLDSDSADDSPMMPN